MKTKFSFRRKWKKGISFFLACLMALSIVPTTSVQASSTLYNETTLQVSKSSEELNLRPAGVNKNGIIYDIKLNGTAGFCIDVGKRAPSGTQFARTGLADETYNSIISCALYDTSVANMLGTKQGVWSDKNYAFAQALVWGYSEGCSVSKMAIILSIVLEMDDRELPDGTTILQGYVNKALNFEKVMGTMYVYDSGTSRNQKIISTAPGTKPLPQYDEVSSTQSYTATESVTLNIKKTDKDTGRPLSGVSFDLYKDDAKVTTVTTNANGDASYTFSAQHTASASATKEYCRNYNSLSGPNKALVNAEYTSKESAQAGADAEALAKAKAEAEALFAVNHTYKAVETKTKTAYYLNPSTTTQTKTYASGDGNGSVTLNFTNARQLGTINVSKQDAETNYLVDGATYGLYARENIVHPDGTTGVVHGKDALVATFPKTGTDGKATLNNLYLGKYYVKEITAPNGYILSDATYHVDLTYAGQTVSVTDASATVTDKVQRASISVSKLDKELSDGKDANIFDADSNGAQGDATIAGATYGLYAREDIVHADGTTGVVQYNNVEGSIHELKATKGVDFVVENAKATAGALLATIKTDENGEFGFENLYNGKYYIKEIKAGEGYLLDTTEYDVDLSYTNQNETVVAKTSTVYETVKKQAFDVVKVGHVSGTSQNAIPLEGVEFTVKLEADVQRLGWESAPAYDVITTDAEGKGSSIELPYGYYRVKETKSAEDYDTAKDFFVTVEEDNRTHQTFTNNIVIDEVYQALLKIVKKDAETGKTVLVPNAEFKLKALTDVTVDGKKFEAGEYVGYWNWNIFDGFYTDAWKTNKDGYVMLNEKLGAGKYQLEEIHAPYGYVLDTEPVTFRVSNADMHETSQNGTTQVVTVEKSDISAKGQITVEKRGEVLVDFKDGKFIYEERGLAGAKYNILAKEDVMDPSNDGTVIHAKGTIVETLTTGANGKATSSKLPLDVYEVVEVQAPHGMVLNSEKHTVELKYADENTPVVFENTTFVNERQKVDINAVKKDADTNEFVANAEITLYAKQDIVSVDGDVLFEAGEAIRTIKTNKEGTADFGTDLPLSTYHLAETKAPLGYASTDVTFNLDARYRGQDTEVVELTSTFVNKPTVVDISKQDITTGVEVKGNMLKILDSKGNVIDSWTSVQGEKHRIKYLHVGETYTLVEELASWGYLKATNVKFTIRDTGDVQLVEMKDELVKGQITVEKRGEVLTGYDTKKQQFIYEEKLVPNAVYEIYADEDIKHPDNVTNDFYKKGDLVATLTTGANGTATTELLPLGKYTVKEIKAPNGMVIDNEIQKVELTYKDQVTELVFDNAKYVNARQKVKLDLNKLDLDENVALKGAEFTVYANKDIKNVDGDIIVTKGQAVSKAVSDKDGNLPFEIDLPIDLDSQTTPVDSSAIDGGFSVNTDENGNLVIGDKNAMFSMKETKHPIGYASLKATLYLDTSYQGQDVKDFTIAYDLYNEMTRVAFTKSDITTGGDVIGAQLSIYPVGEDGKPILGECFDSWVTKEDNPDTKEDESVHLVKGLEPGEYVLRETLGEAIIYGYVTSEDMAFTVEDTGDIQYVDMKDDFTKVEISKTDIVTGEPVVGAQLSVIPLDEKGEPILGETFETWVTDDKPHLIQYLPIGEYILREKLQGQAWDYGYVTAEDVKFTVTDTAEIQKVEMKDDFTKVEITKTDITTGNPVVGAQLSIIPVKEDGTLDLGAVWETWITVEDDESTTDVDESIHYIERIPVGKYVLREVLGQASIYGYVTAEDVEFEVKDTGEIQKVEMKDDFTKVEISKVDEDGKFVEGATLQIVPLDENEKPLMGEAFETWLTSKKAHRMERLPIGKYMLLELSAPAGFHKAEPVVIEVKDTAEVQSFTMVDEHILTDIVLTKVDSKTGDAITGKDFTFTLYADADCKEKIATVNGDSKTGIATFEDLRFGTYYVKETKAPSGYELSEQVVKVVLNEDTKGIGDKYVMSFENTAIPQIQTGDNNHMFFYGMLSVLSLLGCAFVFRKRYFM